MVISRRFALETRRLIHLAWPLLIAQITQMLMGVSDTIMAGRYDAVDMAAVALGFSLTIPLMCFIQGIALALPPLISRLHGKGQSQRVANVSQQAGYLLLAMGLAVLLLYPVADKLVALFPMEPALYAITLDYVEFVLLAMPGFALYQWLRNYCEGLGKTKPTMIITVIGLGVNIIGNYVFIYGAGPIPAFGGAGCGIATGLVIYAMLIATFIYTLLSPTLARYALFAQWHRPVLSLVWRTLKLGMPIAMTLLFEVTLFAVVALLVAPFGATTVAAHQVALNFSALMFMFPLSLGMAVSIRVGYRIGQLRPQQAIIAVKSALSVGLIIAVFTASFTVLAKAAIVSLYTDDMAVFSMANALLIYAALFQFSDAIQVISANVLRGYKDTTAMFLITFCAYWLIGLPTGIILGRTDWLTDAPMSAAGFWIGFIVGLSSAAVMLGARVWVIQRRLA
ncbi:MATE family efflux transporter [Alteromonas halophila]|uniref:Multidrug-efflux transporter n=1 Tax=Alteromonas halophila TaxID=516698 RepID=A0A918JQV8_9ALTE|nr:MATE family efflux transporter [Alteromonas halophila]GGW95751.1 MATE family efflux transporter [Alteromonas halophila]